MKNVLLTLIALLAISGLAFAGSPDGTGSYSINNISIDGESWNFTDVPEVVVGGTYSVSLDTSFNMSSSGGADNYSNGVSAKILFPLITGFEAWTASKITPDEVYPYTTSGNFVDLATWNLTGDLTVPDLFLEDLAEAGFYLYSVSGDVLSEVDFTLRVADVDSAPVPEPSTLLLLGAGLVGLVGYSRRKKA